MSLDYTIPKETIRNREPFEIDGIRYVAERTGNIEVAKSGPYSVVYRHTCCGWEYTLSVVDTFVMPDDYCPKCGARLE